MRKSKAGHERKNSRRRSWLIGNNLFNMFSSAPPSPEYKEVEEIIDSHRRQRSQSLTPIEDRLSSNNYIRPLLRSSQKSAFSNFLTRASSKKKQQLSIQTDYFNYPQPPLQIFKADEDEADRIQLKNDLVKLAFDG